MVVFIGPGDTEAKSYDVKDVAEWEEMDTIQIEGEGAEEDIFI